PLARHSSSPRTSSPGQNHAPICPDRTPLRVDGASPRRSRYARYACRVNPLAQVLESNLPRPPTIQIPAPRSRLSGAVSHLLERERSTVAFHTHAHDMVGVEGGLHRLNRSGTRLARNALGAGHHGRARVVRRARRPLLLAVIDLDLPERLAAIGRGPFRPFHPGLQILRSEGSWHMESPV